jgi:hypothetical protein
VLPPGLSNLPHPAPLCGTLKEQSEIEPATLLPDQIDECIVVAKAPVRDQLESVRLPDGTGCASGALQQGGLWR